MQTFKKVERLCSKILIEKLVEKGNSHNHFPFKINWLEITENEAPVQILITVPKRNFKKAVDRNKLKRQTREAYRKNKSMLYEKLNGKKIILMFIYIGKEKLEYNTIENKIIESLEYVSKAIQK